MRKVTLLKEMSNYFAGKGRILNIVEYAKANDGPYHPATVRKICGSWGRMVNLCLHNYPNLLGSAYKEPGDIKLFDTEAWAPPAPVEPPEEEQEAPLTAAQALALLEGRLDDEQSS
jgi:hypothetical protein